LGELPGGEHSAFKMDKNGNVSELFVDLVNRR